MPRDPFAQDNVSAGAQVASLRYFTDREDFIKAFHKCVNAPAGQPWADKVGCMWTRFWRNGSLRRRRHGGNPV